MKKIKHRHYFLNEMFIPIEDIQRELDISNEELITWDGDLKEHKIDMCDIFRYELQYTLFRHARERELRIISFLKEGIFVQPIHMPNLLQHFWYNYIYYYLCWWMYKLFGVIISDFWWKEGENEGEGVPSSDIKWYDYKDYNPKK